MDLSIHSTASIEPGAVVGAGTMIAGGVFVQAPADIGSDCIVAEHCTIAGAVRVADRVEIGAHGHICAGVTIDSEVLIAPGVVFTNQRYPRAGSPVGADGRIRPTRVHTGASIGARAVIGCDLEIGEHALIGMGAVVTRNVPAHHIVVGTPARLAGFVCCCGEPLLRFDGNFPILHIDLVCLACDRHYSVREGVVAERPLDRKIIPFSRRTRS